MYKEVLTSIDGIEIYPIISLFIFLIFFVTLFIWIKKKDNRYFTQMAQLPLDNKIEGDNYE